MLKKLHNIVEKLRPHFEEGGKFSAFHSLFDGFETFLFTPNTTAKRIGSQIHDGSDSKRTMILVVMALVPALLFGMFNVGYQHFLATGELVRGAMTCALFWKAFAFGALAVLPYIIVSYGVGLGIEFTVAQWKKEEIQEGFLVSGMIIPLIVPINTPLWMVAVATAFAVIFAKEIFGGTGYNIFNVALIARAFLFFAYPTHMTGDKCFVRTEGTWGWDNGQTLVDGFSGATPLTQIATSAEANLMPVDFWTAFNGLIPGSIGETCCWAILLGAALLIVTGVASWKTMLSIFAGGALTAWLFNEFGAETAAANYPWYMHLITGGFMFGAVFMATDPVTSARTECGKWIYGALIGFMAVVIRVLNPGYPEGMMLAILLMNAFAPLIDWCVVQVNIKKRMNRAKKRINMPIAVLITVLSSFCTIGCSKSNDIESTFRNIQLNNTRSLTDSYEEAISNFSSFYDQITILNYYDTEIDNCENKIIHPYTHMMNKYLDLFIDYCVREGYIDNAHEISSYDDFYNYPYNLSIESKIQYVYEYIFVPWNDFFEQREIRSEYMDIYCDLLNNLMNEELNSMTEITSFIDEAISIATENNESIDIDNMIASSHIEIADIPYHKLDVLRHLEDSIPFVHEYEETYIEDSILCSCSNNYAIARPQHLIRYNPHLLWNERVRYRNYSCPNIQMAKTQMQVWSNATHNDITFIEIKDNGWNRFTWGIGCNYHVCLTSTSNQDIGGSATVGCVPWATLRCNNNAQTRTYLHELGHVLGLLHEIQRCDRDYYITIMWDNIKRGYKHNFWKKAELIASPYGSFDYYSIMMYTQRAFSKNNQNTIETKDGIPYGVATTLSQSDEQQINNLY